MTAPAIRRISAALAAAFLAGKWSEDRMARRGRAALEGPAPWIRQIVRGVLELYHRPPLDRPSELATVIGELLRETAAPPAPRVRRWFSYEQRMGRRRWPVAEIDTVAALGDALGLEPGALDWLADPRGLERRAESQQLRNYRYTWLPRGNAPPRAIERPKARLKAAQRQVLREILDLIPAHPASHGFVPGRSARSNAAVHAGRPAILSVDLEDFFASVEARRVFGIFRTAGYAEGVAHMLTSLCTNVVPADEWAALPRPSEPDRIDAHWRLGRRLATPHLPQGAPTSPALANLAAFGLDRRLAGLADRLGLLYSRYADDLTISGPMWIASASGRLIATLAEIARDEGFRLNDSKSRLMTRAGRQRVCGVVVNEHPNVARGEYDRLKAILHNASVRGPAGENRAGHPDFQAHLLGRVAWVEQLNPHRGRRLRERLERIAWD